MKRTAGKYVTITPALATLLMVSSCSSNNDREAVVNQKATCKEMLGDAGANWLSNNVGADKLRMKSTHDQKQAREFFYKPLRGWKPKDSADPYDPFSIVTADVCEARKEGGNTGKYFSLDYSVSFYPFARISAGEGGSTTSANSDLALISRKRLDGGNAYEAYFKCAIPGARAEQEERLPVVGTMTDKLTGDQSVRTHFRYLLHSAQVMAHTLGCQNKPVIPAEPPASVK